MQFDKVTQIYKKTGLSTMSMREYVILLLKECLVAVQKYESTSPEEQNEVIHQAQKVLFELMSITDQKHEKGSRLFEFYVHLNQCLVDVRIHQNTERLQLVERYLTEMIASWENAKSVTSGVGYGRHDVRT